MKYRELRCPECGALWFEEYIYVGRIRVKCRRCKTVYEINYKSSKRLVEKVQENDRINY